MFFSEHHEGEKEGGKIYNKVGYKFNASDPLVETINCNVSVKNYSKRGLLFIIFTYSPSSIFLVKHSPGQYVPFLLPIYPVHQVHG